MKSYLFFLIIIFFPFYTLFAQKKIVIDTIITPKSDGRFTLGTENFRLMYGYPYPYSTSHFIVNVNNKLASNRPYLKNVTYLQGTLKSYEINGSKYSTITFDFEGFKITQKLVPVDRFLEELQKNTFAQYYRVEYEIENINYQDKTKKRVGLIMFFDTQIADNDACIMQTCKYENIRKGKSFLEKILSLFSFGSQKKERLYEKDDIPEVVLVFKSEKRHKDITGAFILNQKRATTPDEVLIGRWPFYKNTRWGYATPNGKNIEYDDSALLLKWKEREAKPFQKHYFATYYGVLDLDTLKMENTKPLEKIATNFRVEPDTIYQGDKAKLIWETKNPIQADIFISGVKGKLSNKGELEVTPLKSQTYTLKLVLQGKEIETQEDFLTVLPKGSKPKNIKIEPKKENNITKKEEDEPLPNKKSKELDKKYDGRFTLGSENKNLTYGYPFHYSTSHFVLQVNGKNASNYDGLGTNYTYLAGNLITLNNKASYKTQVEYEFEGITIIQKLIPVNTKLEEVKNGIFGQYYLIEYTFKNNSTASKEIAFALMLDIMVDDDDNAFVKIKDKKVTLNTKLKKENLGNSLLVISSRDENEMGEFIFDKNKATQPDEILVGTWQHLNTAGYQPNITQKTFTSDLALHLKWNKKSILPKENTTFSFYFGNSKYKLNILHHQKKSATQHNVFFNINQSTLTQESLKTLKEVLKHQKYTYLVVEGFTDKTGTADLNYALSQKRVKSVVDFLVKNGVDNQKILIKSHGQYFAGKKTDEKERRVSVVVYE
jgi:outer membrane protein OmpA-like peptidoglycan-associated protein